MADETPPPADAASEPWEREKAYAVDRLEWGTRELVANLLRVMRGAGRPLELPQQIVNFAESILEVSKTARLWAVSSAIEDALYSAFPRNLGAPEREEDIRIIVSGSLQLLASRLVHQRAQEAAGEREIVDGASALAFASSKTH